MLTLFRETVPTSVHHLPFTQNNSTNLPTSAVLREAVTFTTILNLLPKTR